MAPTATVSNPTNGTVTKWNVIKTESATNSIDATSESSLQAISYGGILPGIPSHPTFAAHRLWALSHMTALFRHWSRNGYTLGMSGHISLRDPEFPHCFWMNPLAVHFGLLRVSDMLLISDSPDSDQDGGKILAGNRLKRPANKAGWAIHSAVHRARPDVNAACHAHTPYGKIWSAMGGRRLEMVDQDVCNLYGDALAVYGDYGGVVVGGAIQEGAAIASALGPRGKGMILVNHGLLSVGKTVDEAGFMFGLLEKSCRVQVELRQIGDGAKKMLIRDREAEFNFKVASDPETLFWEFQPDYDYEVAMSHDKFIDLEEKDLKLIKEGMTGGFF